MTWEERMGRAAYEAYARELNPEPRDRGTWTSLSPALQQVWSRVARAVVHKAAEDNPKESRMR